MLEPYARSLVHEGFTVVPQHIHQIPKTLIDEAGEAVQQIIKYMATLPCKTAVQRPGESEAEVGLVKRLPKDGKDLKYFLHFAHDFATMIGAEPELRRYLLRYNQEFTTLQSLYRDLIFFIVRMLHKVSEELNALTGLKIDLIDQFNESCYSSIPNGTTTLRGLWYPAVKEQRGATGHLDRSLITAHLGDYGGSLFGHKTMSDDGRFELSPKDGEILLFWGIKALLVGDGRLKPLWHSATTRSGKDRTALVLFGHIKTVPQIEDTKRAFAQLCVDNGIENPEIWYTESWR